MRRFFRIAIAVLAIICLLGGGMFLLKQKKKTEQDPGLRDQAQGGDRDKGGERRSAP